MLYKVLLLTTLLHLSYGAATVTISLTSGGTAVVNGEANAKLDDAVTITCTYNADYDGTYETGTLNYKETPSSEAQKVANTGGGLQEPWESAPNNPYSVENAGRGVTPYFMRFTITKVAMKDSGEYICGITDNNNQAVISEDTATVSVAANVARVELSGVDNGNYKVLDDGNQRAVICTAYNGSRPSMQLTIGEINLDFEENNIILKENAVYEATLYYTFLPEQNGKEIICKAVVPGYESEPIITRAVLQIQARPTISCPAAVEGKVLETVTIECEITGSPLPDRDSIEWRVAIANDGYTLKADASSDNLGMKSTLTKETDLYRVKLLLTIAKHSFGEYTLGAENEGGYKEQTVVVTEKRQGAVDDGNGASLTSASIPLLLALFYSSLL